MEIRKLQEQLADLSVSKPAMGESAYSTIQSAIWGLRDVYPSIDDLMSRSMARVITSALTATTLSPKGDEWLPIESAPRNSSRLLIAYESEIYGWKVHEAWWGIPYEGAPDDKGSWRIDGNSIVLDASLHGGLGAKYWQPLPTPPRHQARLNGEG